jgi:hypothetical protein
MSSWGNNDNAANAPHWAVNSTLTTVDAQPVGTRPTAANVALLYGNTTPNVYTTGETIGLFGVDANEEKVAKSSVKVAPAHSGWVLRTTGSGGRAGRVTQEVLVALNTMSGDGDGQVYANVSINLVVPSNASVVHNTGGANSVNVTVTPTLTGNTSAALTYQWQVNAGGSWVNVANGTPANTNYITGGAATLNITPTNVDANNDVYRVIVTAADEGVTATSSNVALTVY